MFDTVRDVLSLMLPLAANIFLELLDEATQDSVEMWVRIFCLVFTQQTPEGRGKYLMSHADHFEYKVDFVWVKH